MEKAYHQIIPLLVLDRSPTLAGFFKAQGGWAAKLMADAIRPDEVYHDNIIQDAQIHLAHSYKLAPDKAGVLRWKKGDCVKRIEAISADVENWYKSKDFDLVCRGLGELSHYIIDAHTYPHLVIGQPWARHHMPWEIKRAKWLEKNKGRLGKLHFYKVKSIYKTAAADARAMYPDALKMVAALERGIDMTDGAQLGLARYIATQLGCCWLTITDKLFPKE